MDKELYEAESNTTKVQAGWKGRKKEFPKSKKLAKDAEKIVKALDMADQKIEEALKLDKKADETYDKLKMRA